MTSTRITGLVFIALAVLIVLVLWVGNAVAVCVSSMTVEAGEAPVVNPVTCN